MSADAYGATEEEAHANAALIASAPDLLAERDRLLALNAELLQALVEISGHASGGHGITLGIIHKKARAALKSQEPVGGGG